jgi:EKC/KEOPS complex subunit CGI121/TPRKB
VYKIGCAKGGKKEKRGINGDAGKKDDRSDIESVILGTIALKGS